MPARRRCGCGATRATSPPRSTSSRASSPGRWAATRSATVGALSLRPNLINVVPNRAVFTVDLRNTDEAKLKEAEARVAAHIAEVAAAERVEVEAKVLARFEPVIFDAGLVDRVEHHAGAARSRRGACPRAPATTRR